MITLPRAEPCAVCHKEIDQDRGWVYHVRLNAYVCFGCPRQDVHGEDISSHTLFWCPPKEKP